MATDGVTILHETPSMNPLRPSAANPAPRTAIFLRYVGFGDLIWHLPYIRALAKTSYEGKVSVIAAPSTMATEILSIEPSVAEVILFDRNKRRHEQRRVTYGGAFGLWRFAHHLRNYGFERILLFSSRPHHALLAWLADIPQRAGYGQGILQRLFLNSPPYIGRYAGPAVPQYEEAANFALAAGLLECREVPKMQLTAEFLEFGRTACSGLPPTRIGLIIGTSEARKHWGDANFAELLQQLVAAGYGVVLLGGPREQDVAARIISLASLSDSQREQVRPITNASILQMAGVLRELASCVGNDTGALNLAAANDVVCLCTLGERPLLLHDPLITCIGDKPIEQITAMDVFGRIQATMQSRDAIVGKEANPSEA